MHGKKKNVSVWLEPELIARMDKLVQKAEISRAKFIENILRMSVEELEVVDKLGIFKFSLILRDLREGIHGWAEGLKGDPDQFGVPT